MKTEILKQEKLTQLHEELLRMARLLERAGVSPRPEVAKGWVDGQEVMNALSVSERTLRTWRTNGTLGYSTIGGKFFYKTSEIQELLENNYVMYRLQARGKE